jgi:hypothetical protein
VRSPSVTQKIDETAIRTSKIMSSALLFLKYYLLKKYDDFAHSDHDEGSILPIIPKVDIKLARAALKTISGMRTLDNLRNAETIAVIQLSHTSVLRRHSSLGPRSNHRVFN